MQQDWRKRHLGLFALLAVLLTLGALVQDVRFDQALARDRAALTAVAHEVSAVDVALADLRSAQSAYIAVGQAPEFWMQRADDLTARIETGLTQLREGAASPDLRTRYDTALAVVGNLAGLDTRARDLAGSDQRYLAADVVFVESVEISQRLRGELERIRAAETALAEGRMERTGWMRLALNAFAMGFVLLLGLALARPAPRPATASGAALTAQMIRDLPPPVKPAPALARPTAATPPAPAVNLPGAADLCVDLARVMDGRDVPALLERAAEVLDARGLIVWLVDGEGQTLRPSLAHGYSDKVLGRLGTLDVAADNVTSLAFRSMRPQSVAGNGSGAAGAVAVPLVTAAGCTGVLSAELRDNKPAPEVLAVTRIVAAQFASLIGPADAVPARAVEA